MIDALGQIDAVIEQHHREIERLQVARSVLLELTAQPNRVKGAVIEAKNRSQGITIQRISAPVDITPPTTTTSERKKPLTGKARQMSMEANAKLTDRIVTLLEKHGPMESKKLGDRIGFKPGENRQRLFQRVWDLKNRGAVVKLPDGRLALAVKPEEERPPEENEPEAGSNMESNLDAA